MGLFQGKKGVILGIANNRSIASAVGQVLTDQGAELAVSFLPDPQGKMEKRVQSVVKDWNPQYVGPCDASNDESIDEYFKGVEGTLGKIDFLVHSIAFAPMDDIKCATLDCSRPGFLQAMDISVYSLIATAKRAAELTNPGASICAMTYFGGEKVIPGYNLMGVCKSALDQTIRYLAHDLGPRSIRVNGISAGPIRTLASSAVGDFKEMLKCNEAQSPLGRNVTTDEVAQSAAFLLSQMSSATTGEILHVDSGYNIMGAPTNQLKEVLKS